MTATHNSKITTKTDVLYLAFELGESDWKLAFTVGMGQKPRLRSMPSRDLPRLHEEIAKSQATFSRLPADAPVKSCYEAGRDGLCVGLTPTPYQSGDSHREQGISKAGNRRLRRLMVELAWCWLRWQPDSELSRTQPQDRRGRVGPQTADRLVEYVEQGEVPAGARMASWQKKVRGCSKDAA